MSEPLKQPVFLERHSYRQRRMMDAVRLLPVCGFVLWFLPTLWSLSFIETGAGVPMSRAFLYVFGVWVFLIVTSAVLWCFLIDTGQNSDTDSPSGDEAA